MRSIFMFIFIFFILIFLPIHGNSIEKEIKQVALNYANAYEQGNVTLMKKTIHQKLVKRGLYKKDGKVYPLSDMNYKELMILVKRNKKKAEVERKRNLHTKVKIHNIFKDIANVTLKDDLYIEYLGMIKDNGEWKIINVLWMNR